MDSPRGDLHVEGSTRLNESTSVVLRLRVETLFVETEEIVVGNEPGSRPSPPFS